MQASIDDLRTLIQPGDLHLIVSRETERCRVWRRTADGGDPLLEIEMRNRTVNAGEGHWGHLPGGSYLVGAPSDCHVVSLGWHFSPLFDLDPHGPMHEHGRTAIGMHGGGTGLPDPFAAEQGWVDTEGCLRVQNRDNRELVILLRECHAAGRRAYLTNLVAGENA